MERVKIDLVYTFCDGADPEHLKQRNLYRQPSIADSSRQCRYRSNGEIYASIASALTFAPWIRTIFVIVADGQEELFEKGWPIFFDGQQYPVNRITVVPHSVIYAEAKLLEHLPTFNSQSIECHLHRIPGLENHFLYSNDDTFFGDHVTPATFYTAPNKPKICYSKTLMPHPGARDKMNKESWYWSRVNNVNLLNRLMPTGAVKSDLPANHILLRNSLSRQQRFRQRYMLIHQIKPLTKQIYEDAWKNSILQPWLIQTSASRFRSLNDIEPVGLLLEWKSDCNQTARCKLRSSTLSIDDYNSLDKLFDKIEQGHYALYCINDNMIIANPGRIARFKQGLQTRLPHCRITTA